MKIWQTLLCILLSSILLLTIAFWLAPDQGCNCTELDFACQDLCEDRYPIP